MGIAFRHLRDLFGAGSVIGLGDGQLLARYSSSKDEAAFEALVSRHGPMVLATCRAILKNEHDVEDAFQATFLVLAKKARSIRGGDALGGWLHRVAYRASVKASIEAKRRRQKEAEASAMAPLDASRPGFETELKPILHEEIDRLPEGHRLPVVLCDLEGLTYEQAAEQLRWTVPTLRCRLAKARQRLKVRLTRRGVTSLAVGVSLAPKGASASVPAALIRSTVLAATGGSASGGAALLTHAILRGMLMTKIKIASTAALAALALASAGIYAAGAGRPDDPKPVMKSKADLTAKAAPIARKPAEMVEIKGRVVSPDGKPVAGALVKGAYVDRESKPLPQATSGPDGGFTIRLPRPSDNGGVPKGYMARFPWLIASAPGYGLGWTEAVLRSNRPAEQEVKLVEDGTPIEGRVIDLEGRPVADAKVKLNRVWFADKGELSGWIAKVRNGSASNLWQGLDQLSLDEILPIQVRTGPDGRFKLSGIGRERIADLLVSGPGVSTTQVIAFCRDEPEIRDSQKGMMHSMPFNVHSPKFQLALAPSKRVEGIARDKDSGKPIAGLELKAAVFDEHSSIWAEGVGAKTDSEGRYRIDGLPKASAFRLFVSPGPGLPYTIGSLRAPADSPGLDPVAFDFTMKRGVIVRGKVTDKETGRPVRGWANYYTFHDNPNVGDYPGFGGNGQAQAYINQEDGSFELVALPGRGLIGVRAEEERHKGVVGADKIAGYDAKMKTFATLPYYCHIANYHIITEVNLDPKAEPARLELQADPGKSVAVEVVGPDGQPLGGTTVKGKSELFQSSAFPEESTSFEVHALDPARPRRVIVTHQARKLIGSALLRGDEHGPVTIRLVPWGTVAGRIVDDEGKPRKAMFISSATGNERRQPETDDVLPGSDWNNGIAVGNDGLFRVEGLVPGLRYSTTARTGFEPFGDLFTNLTVAPGEVKDLGDLKVQPPKKTEE
jgi:RNA polymerase sigma factor (sigma-70 family)